MGCGSRSAATSQPEIPILLKSKIENENDLSLLVDTENTYICFVPFAGGR